MMSLNTARPLLGCIADDFTGATDLANMLVRGGMRTVQSIGIPSAEMAAGLDADAIVIALKSRTTPSAEAVAESLAALEWLRERGCEQIFFKYCSTFDSTAAGNIGQVSEALLEQLGSDFTLACPAFPENGRTIFRGHLFVQDQLLSESGMQNHPLTPMTDANLVRVLQAQTTHKVGLLRYDTVAKGVESVRGKIAELRAEGVSMAIADALSDADLYTLGEACADLPLLTGGSGLALGLPGNFRKAGKLRDIDAAKQIAISGGEVVLAGSASVATNGQVAAWLEANRPALRINPLDLAAGKPVVEQALAFARDAAQTVLIYATSTPDEVKAVQKELGVERSGAMVEAALGEIAKGLFDAGVRRFVVAGGETSGSVVQALGVQLLQIGAQIDPGVPATVSSGSEPLALALKSGNFGARDFFAKALKHLAGEA
ncbi:HopAN1 protein [Pseudomonas coronafaciens pv. garcae]|uniref:3-oxo-tetronate kinase n=2 Tax=Pseudomonas syringae group TaxID=136849 RepID=A0AB37QMM7_9PSED|nr:HopAN1 protein [Pseudomonas coronafaciens pv. coronafaciens]RMR99125.1 HopAN1 protein [Pseudomonas coronafaciens pv. garcae]RMS00191.1 HopAN1 protein [Pseudomonas coronafaciens pv. garcae]RMS34355.1 HopAN1 protein [Pseudomonas coronafaciens pv. garcae]RMV03694.1 HopAN1 protein [Pseudomonas coronafaciens pv. coronafaciens]